jgi:hypothetical protein
VVFYTTSAICITCVESNIIYDLKLQNPFKPFRGLFIHLQELSLQSNTVKSIAFKQESCPLSVFTFFFLSYLLVFIKMTRKIRPMSFIHSLDHLSPLSQADRLQRRSHSPRYLIGNPPADSCSLSIVEECLTATPLEQAPQFRIRSGVVLL